MTEAQKQQQQVLEFLQTGKELHKQIAIDQFGISNIRPVISKLKGDGHDIVNLSSGNDTARYLLKNGKPKQAPKPKPEQTFPKMVRVSAETNKSIKRIALESGLKEGEIYLAAIDRGINVLNKKFSI